MLRRALILAMLLPMDATADGNGPWPGYLRLHTETRGFLLGRPASPRPTPDGRAVLFLRAGPRSPEQSLYEFEIATGKTRELCTPKQLLKGALEHLSAAEKARRERMRQAARGFTFFDVSDDGALVLVALSGRLYTVARPGGAVAELSTGETPVEDPRFSPDGKRIAYVRDHDLYTYELATRKETRLTRSLHPRIESGRAEFVAQEEMNRFSGYWWSPDSSQLAFEEADSRLVETFHLVDVAHPEAEPHAVPYPRPGKTNVTVRLGVIAATGGEASWIKWDSGRLPYLTSVVWRDQGPLTLVVMDRNQRTLEVLAADPGTGATRLLLVEQDDAWLNLDQSTPRWLPGGSAFLWSSERDGVRTLEVRARGGELLRVLGRNAGYVKLVHVDAQAGQVYFIGSLEPTELHLARIAIDGGTVEWLTRDPGEHDAVFGRGHPVWVETAHTLDSMPKATVHTVGADGKPREAGELPSVAESPPFLPQAILTRTGDESWRVSIIRPRSFQADRKYPVVLDVYGGPHHRHVTRTMAQGLLRQWIADHGFIVVSVDGRGTPQRGRTWERAIRGDFAGVTLDDQAAALKALGKSHPELDLDRVGAFGWSFGGYMAALAVLRRPDLFKVGVAGAPVVDWLDYDTFYTERYLGLPERNAEAYRKSSLLTYAASLSRPLLLIHGTSDDNVYFSHTLKLAQALLRAGKPFDLLPLPGLTHMVPDPVIKEQIYARIVGTLSQALKP
ncbi:MAG: S9 family peptidase [Myxococcales bacterium]|nr:S9 family peptidase [Myxococcales bacterium]